MCIKRSMISESPTIGAPLGPLRGTELSYIGVPSQSSDNGWFFSLDTGLRVSARRMRRAWCWIPTSYTYAREVIRVWRYQRSQPPYESCQR